MSINKASGRGGKFELQSARDMESDDLPKLITRLPNSENAEYYSEYDGTFSNEGKRITGAVNGIHRAKGALERSFTNKAYLNERDLNNNPMGESNNEDSVGVRTKDGSADKYFHSSHENIDLNSTREYGELHTEEDGDEELSTLKDPRIKKTFKADPSERAHFQNESIDGRSGAKDDFGANDEGSKGQNGMINQPSLGNKIMGIIEESRGKKSLSVMIEDAQALTYNMEKLEFKESVLSFQDITYIIRGKRKRFWNKKPKPVTILDHVSGIFSPGVNAIMGPSGGGKTSLLTILGGRKEVNGVEGTILMNGQSISKDFKTESGFVAQEDVLMGTLTVRENIMFSASVRLPSKIPVKTKRKMVEIVINELNLGKCADSLVGTEFIRGVSGGEKKRCNIGVELITIPSILFLDEPTSGLDAATANTVVALLKKLSDKGCNIIMSIHQPRFDIFKMFNTLILLSTGRVVYHGLADHALDYFCSQGFECEIHNNPADYFLDVIERNAIRPKSAGTVEVDVDNAEGNEIVKIDMAQKYKDSGIYDRVQDALNQIKGSREVEGKKRFFACSTGDSGGTVYPTTFCTQLKAVSKRTVKNLYRNPQSMYVQSFTMIIYSLIVGSIYFQVDSSARYGLQNRSGALFFMIMNQVFGNLSAIELFIRERALYIHETTNGFYRVSVYFISKLSCDLIPMRFIPVMLVAVIAYWMIGLQHDFGKYVVFIVSLICLTTSASSIALFASVTFSVIGIATNYCALYFVFMMVFGGLFVNLNSISYGIRWLKYLSIFRYANNALLINEIKDQRYCDSSTDPSRNSTTLPCVYGNEYLEKQGIPYKTHWDLWMNHFALICIILLFWIMSYIQLRRLKKNARG